MRVPTGTSQQVAAVLEEAEPVSSQARLVADGSFTYRVKAGDTLSSISETFGSKVTAIQAANGIRNRNQIRVGQRLTIPVGSERPLSYQVRRGDTLTAIAQKFGTSPTSIRRANSLVDANRIAFGQILLIP
jgi:LysM repeat protein